MSKACELMQRPDDHWTIEIHHESGIMVATPLGQLSKEQAIRETQRRGFTTIRVWDKTVLAAIADGTARMDTPLPPLLL